jgi:predicted enzyme related to lactoylglutathione lyase
MLNMRLVMLYSENPKKLTDFYKKVFEKEPEWSDGDYSAFKAGNGSIMIGKHDKVKGNNKTPERMMFNLETKEVVQEFERIKKFGTKVVAEPYDPMPKSKALIATLSDPDGNYFQLATPWE